MQIEIDQSGKIENTSVNTVIAFSNSKRKSILITAKEKRKLQKAFREFNKSPLFVYKTFALLIYFLIKDDFNKIQSIIIDQEYPGKENEIKTYLFRQFKKDGINFSAKNIHFLEIGRKSRAHFCAYDTSRGKIVPRKIITAKNLKIYIN